MREKEFYIHIGIHKTGTTSIQRMFVLNRLYFMDKGLFYPSKCIWKGGHHNLAWDILGDSRKNDKYGTLQELKIEIKENFSSNCLISSEDFSRFGPKQRETLYKHFQSYNPKIILYIRNQYDYIVSSWSTVIREETMQAPFRQYYNFCMRKRFNLLNYHNFLKEWADIFGKENLIVKIYDKNLGLDLQKDFLNALNITAELKELDVVERTNTSLPFQELNVIRMINKHKLQLDYKTRTAFLDDLLTEINENYVVRQKIVQPRDRVGLRKHTDDFFKESNQQVAQDYFNREELFLNLKSVI